MQKIHWLIKTIYKGYWNFTEPWSQIGLKAVINGGGKEESTQQREGGVGETSTNANKSIKWVEKRRERRQGNNTGSDWEFEETTTAPRYVE